VDRALRNPIRAVAASAGCARLDCQRAEERE